ncbi:homocysteine S-methyltransferase family protein [Tropicimonas sp. S265A]|uniref:homocysteine S-methyltransferase family protein n=1 Tax=Tropicimonas sp. S265A TaxID=3415134 RepID=UPI003C7CB1C7
MLPGESDKPYLVYAGTGTDLIFNHGVDMPGFASFPLLETQETRCLLAEQMEALARLAGIANMGCILDTPTWMANADRAAPLGYGVDRLEGVNKDAASLMESVRQKADRNDILLSACIGPRQDPYAETAATSVSDARKYHAQQLNTFKGTSVDFATAYTFNRIDEAAGCILAAKDAGLPIVMSLVVETDGRLDDGTPLLDAIDQIDQRTERAAEYFMVNCAHPSHFFDALEAHPRLMGVVANASTCSHAELDEATTLDDGDPEALGREIADVFRRNPGLRVFGGCCGTDMRHMASIVRSLPAR